MIDDDTNNDQTPGSIFSKVKQMFSPWYSTDSDASIQSLPETPLKSESETPLNSQRRLDALHSSHRDIDDDTNAKLAMFFQQKGSEPLNEIEMEGVRSLLSRSSKATPVKVEQSPDDSIVLKNVKEADSTLSTPSFKPTYNESKVERAGTPKRRVVYDYSGFPSPYRTSRLKSSLKIKQEVTEPKKEEHIEVKEPKKLSNTASALLSFIESNEPKQETKQEEKKELDFSNPYAREKKAVIKKLSPLEQLEKSLNSIENKYKPAKSSSLRESVSMDDSMEVDNESIPDDKTEEDDKKEKEEIQEKKTQGFMFAPASSDKPLFSFGQPVETVEPKPKERKPVESKPMQLTKPVEKGLHDPSGNLSCNLPQLTLSRPSQVTRPSSSSEHVALTPRSITAESDFQFPNALDSGVGVKDVDEQRVKVLKDLFSF
jgi:nucleoporin NUP60